jgi:hypothetical protein
LARGPQGILEEPLEMRLEDRYGPLADLIRSHDVDYDCQCAHQRTGLILATDC